MRGLKLWIPISALELVVGPCLKNNPFSFVFLLVVRGRMPLVCVCLCGSSLGVLVTFGGGVGGGRW